MFCLNKNKLGNIFMWFKFVIVIGINELCWKLLALVSYSLWLSNFWANRAICRSLNLPTKPQLQNWFRVKWLSVTTSKLKQDMKITTKNLPEISDKRLWRCNVLRCGDLCLFFGYYSNFYWGCEGWRERLGQHLS